MVAIKCSTVSTAAQGYIPTLHWPLLHTNYKQLAIYTLLGLAKCPSHYWLCFNVLRSKLTPCLLHLCAT